MRPNLQHWVLSICLWSFLLVGSECGNVPRGGLVAASKKLKGITVIRRPWSPLSKGGTKLEKAQALLPTKEMQDHQVPRGVISSSPTSTTTGTPISPSVSFVSKLPLVEVLGIAVLTGIQRAVMRLFQTYQIDFPPMLAGCLGLVAFLLFADLVVQPGLGESINHFLLPGSLLLAKWFPVLFLPSLVLLPLAPSLGDGWEVAKFLSVVVIGFFYSFLVNVFAVQWTQKIAGHPTTHQEKHHHLPIKKTPVIGTSAPANTKPKIYDDATMSFLSRATLASTASVVAASWLGNDGPSSRLLVSRLRTLMDLCTSFTSYVWASRLPSKLTATVHPIMISSLLQVLLFVIMGQMTGSSLVDVLHTYKAGTLQWKTTGAADVMNFFLGPSVVSFATALFARRRLVWTHFHFVLVASVLSSVGGLFGTAWLVRLLQLKEAAARLSSLPRSVTTALAIPCVTMLGGDVSLTVLIVVLTGAFGATYGRTLLNALKVQDPTIRGLAIGGSAQGLGVASMSSEPDAYPFAAITMILTAILSTILVSIHPVKDLLVRICLAKN